MGWTPSQFYAETIADIQIAIAAHYDRVEYEQNNLVAIARRMTYFIVNTAGFIKREIKESDIMELPHEREERLRRKAENAFTKEEIEWWLERWEREGPGIKNGKDATLDLMAFLK